MARRPNATPPAPLPNGHDADTGAADDATGIEVVVDDGADTGQAAPAPAAAASEDSVESLRAQLDAANRRAETAEQTASRLAAERGRDAEVIQDSRLLVIESTINARETEKAALRQQIKEAKEAGDYDAEIEATDKLQQINIDLKQAKLGKERIESEIESRNEAPASEDQNIEKWFEDNKIGPASRNWLRSHKDYLTDPVKNADLSKAHHLAVRAGHVQNTPSYFEHVEIQLGLREDPDADRGAVDPPTPTPAPRQQAAPAAPVSRTDGIGNQSRPTHIPGILENGPGKYRITNDANGAAIREAAQMSGITVAEYVKHALSMKRDGNGQLN